MQRWGAEPGPAVHFRAVPKPEAPRDLPTFADVRRAATRIAAFIHHTPVLTSRTLDAAAGAELFFKCECFQRVGAFKYRGATNAAQALPTADADRGVATHSSGNHAAALALAARVRDIPAFIVMPRTAPAVKRAAVAGYGAEITLCEPTLEARESTLAEVVARTGATEVHPYDEPMVIAGQGTAALELLEEVSGLDAVIAPVGGGGLLSGTALAVRGLAPRASVLGAEPVQADDAARSLAAGCVLPSEDPQTVADGLLTALSQRTFAIISREVEGIVTVPEAAIVAAMRLVWERMKILIEPSAAVPVAALLDPSTGLAGKRVGVILSGGNVDLEHLPWSSR